MPPPDPAKSPAPSKRIGDFASLVKVVRSASPGTDQTPEGRRKLLADLCKLLGGQAPAPAPKKPTALPKFPPRTQAVLTALLAGKSEKEVATQLEMSVHTVHVHVKAIYKKLDVTSRAELMAKCLAG